MSNDFQKSGDSGKALASFVQFFERQGWGFSQEKDKPVIHTGFSGQNGKWLCLAASSTQDDHLIFLSLLPCKAPEHRRAACGELLTRINFGLTRGCFEMDFDNGEVRFRTNLAVTPSEISPDQVERLVFSNLSILDRFFGTIMKVIYADIPPKAVLVGEQSLKVQTPRFELN